MTPVVPGGWPGDAEVRTARLRLEPVRAAHAAAMAAVLADPALYEVTGGDPPDVADLERRYRRWERPVSDDGREGWLNWVVLAGGEAVGTVQATTWSTGAGPAAELAWVVGVPFQRRGYATEAVGGVLAWLRERGVREVLAHVAPGHAASEGVARRVGLRPTGEFRDDGEQLWHQVQHVDAGFLPPRPAV
ncbi:GNAT family N-acetyltransferase [Saccharothrix sp. Mg75]|uniref:GNAT family N-acetyltransferase n=1 Tax=Saccharothrix sp. Mg75 TaxID=3445357 RepID=UPI003EE8525D